MKNYLLLLTTICSISLCSIAQIKQPVWTTKDRWHLLNGLKSSQFDFITEIEKLKEKQIHFKPDSTQWSIAEVTEHIGIYEELLYWDLLNNQYTEERPDLVDKVKSVDSAMIAYTNDPNKLLAPFVAQPLGRFKKTEDLLNFFNRYRNEVIKLIQETKADFRLHFIFRPPDSGIWRIRDLHQYTLLWIAHTERHLNQIKRIKADTNFPQ